MYTLEQLQQKSLKDLKEIGWQLNVLPEGDRRRRQSWIDALVNINPPLLQLLEVSPGVEVDRVQEPIIETVEASPASSVGQVQEPPIESRFGRIVYPQPAQEAIAQATENSIDAKVDLVQGPIEIQAQGAIVPMAETFPGVEVDPFEELIVPVAKTSPATPTFQVGDLVQSKTMVWGIERKSMTGTVLKRLPRGGVRVQFGDHISGYGGSFDFSKSQREDLIPVQEQIVPMAETSPAAAAEQAQEPPIESKFGHIVYPRPAQELITQVVEISPGVKLDPVQESISQNEEARPQLDRTQSADVHNRRSHPAKSDRDNSGAKTEALGSKEGDRVLAVARDGETDRGRVLPDQSIKLVNQAQEPIAQVSETSPGVEVDPVEDFLPECSNCFGDGYVEDEFGFVKFCQCETEPKLSHQKTQRAIAQVAKTSPGVEVKKYYRHGVEYFLVPEIPAAPDKNPAVEVDGCIYCTSPEYDSWRDETYKCYRCKPDQNPILTGLALSDRFIARYSPPQPENIRFKSDADGQLSLLDFEVELVNEPPDPDDFPSIDAFNDAMARWDAENAEALTVSMDSMCEWAPCPDEWYEPEPESLLLKASSMMELSPLAIECSVTSANFTIPTFDAWCDRANRQTDTDEPPDTGFFARLPRPKPPKFPPQASQAGIPKLSRNYPETIPKLFSRVAAGSSTQPARSPPGGEA